MLADIQVGKKNYKVDLSIPLDISIPLINDHSPVAFGAEPYSASPFTTEGFIGSLEQGSPVNFYNLKINPHGNGTHTESVLHIDKRGMSINKTLNNFHFLCQVISIDPQTKKNGDVVITAKDVKDKMVDDNNIKALAIRTLPNAENKKSKNYTNTNPGYMDHESIKYVTEFGIDHLLLDLPSVDKEMDEGKLVAHKAFWDVTKTIQNQRTITEMIYIDNQIEDGLYLLNLQIISLEIDASPSKPVLYKILV